jgi:hypothetical protein
MSLFTEDTHFVVYMNAKDHLRSNALPKTAQLRACVVSEAVSET